ncbi:MAG TPA: MarR family transcriptional regulator [Candidatus Limnocylindria bacterium]|jgi:DNA-binding MarR family transcriptional regulator
MGTRARPPIGQLLGGALRGFRIDLYARAQDAGYGDIREAHLQVFGTIDWRGTRLTELAARSNMTRPAMAELVDELEQAGYLVRSPDPSDGRAKLIRPTRKGRLVLAKALRAVEGIERGYAAALGQERFGALVGTLQTLLSIQSEMRETTASRTPILVVDRRR